MRAASRYTAQYRTLEMTDEEYEQLKTELGYNDPVIVQYGRWMGKVLQGDFGVSTSSHTGVWPLIKAKLPATVGLMAASIVFSLLVSIPLGMLAGYFENSWFDRITNGLHYVAISIPSFWFAIMLIILFSLNLGWLPSSGMRTTGVHTFWDLSRHAIMPVLVLSIGKISIYARYVRAATIQQLSEDYVLFAISKGASRVYILLRHVLKNCLLPVITLVGMNLGSLVSGAYIVETIFGWPVLTSISCFNVASALPESISSAARLMPSAMLSALPPIYNAAPAFISTAFLLCPFSPFKMASVIAAFSSGVPPASCSWW